MQDESIVAGQLTVTIEEGRNVLVRQRRVGGKRVEVFARVELQDLSHKRNKRTMQQTTAVLASSRPSWLSQRDSKPLVFYLASAQSAGVIISLYRSGTRESKLARVAVNARDIPRDAETTEWYTLMPRNDHKCLSPPELRITFKHMSNETAVHLGVMSISSRSVAGAPSKILPIDSSPTAVLRHNTGPTVPHVGVAATAAAAAARKKLQMQFQTPEDEIIVMILPKTSFKGPTNSGTMYLTDSHLYFLSDKSAISIALTNIHSASKGGSQVIKPFVVITKTPQQEYHFSILKSRTRLLQQLSRLTAKGDHSVQFRSGANADHSAAWLHPSSLDRTLLDAASRTSPSPFLTIDPDEFLSPNAGVSSGASVALTEESCSPLDDSSAVNSEEASPRVSCEFQALSAETASLFHYTDATLKDSADAFEHLLARDARRVELLLTSHRLLLRRQSILDSALSPPQSARSSLSASSVSPPEEFLPWFIRQLGKMLLKMLSALLTILLLPGLATSSMAVAFQACILWTILCQLFTATSWRISAMFFPSLLKSEEWIVGESPVGTALISVAFINVLLQSLVLLLTCALLPGFAITSFLFGLLPAYVMMSTVYYTFSLRWFPSFRPEQPKTLAS
ncbi:MAG: GRAM domain-containing protein [archaeon]|nr:GRAM domain-containing protein [archaeon]